MQSKQPKTTSHATQRQTLTTLPDNSMLPLWRSIHQSFMTRSQSWGLPTNASMVLLHLHVHPEDGEPALLAELTYFSRQTMTFTLDNLEKRGLTRRLPHPSDRRRKRIELTPAGEALSVKMLKDLLTYEAHALATIPADQIEYFKKCLASYANALAQQNEPEPLRSKGQS